MPTCIIEYKLRGAATGNLMTHLQAVECETVEMAVKVAQSSLDARMADEAVVYEPARRLVASRQIEVTDISRGRNLPIRDLPDPSS